MARLDSLSHDTPTHRHDAEPFGVLVGFAEADAQEILALLQDRNNGSWSAVEPEPWLDALDDGSPPAVICFGPRLDIPTIRRGFERTARFGRRIFHVVIGTGEETPKLYDLVAEDRIAFLSPAGSPAAELADLLGANLKPPTERPPESSAEAPETLDLLMSEVLGQRDPSTLATKAAGLLRRLVAADHVDCFLYDSEDETLSSCLDEDPEAHSAVAGTVGFALKARRAAAYAPVASSPFFDPDIDAPPDRVDDSAPILALPLTRQASADRAYAVWVLWRIGKDPFTPEDTAKASSVLQPLSPMLEQMADRALDQRRRDRRRSDRRDAPFTFRSAALDYYQRGLPEHGRLLKISPEWTRLAYPALLTLFALAVLFAIFGRIHEYAEGTALVRLEERLDVTATVGGTVSEILVQPGDPVSQGALLVKLYNVQEEAELERIQREFELGRLARQRRPSDPTTARTLGALRAQRRLAESRLEERTVRAPVDGIVGDVLIREGRLLSPGEGILTLQRQDENRRVMVILAGKYRPQIRPGMPIRFEPDGFRYAYQHLTVERVSDEILGPAEARRALGPGMGDAVPLEGPVLLVEARLPEASFESDGRTYAFHDGSLGRAELRIRSESILLTLVPGLKAMWAPRSAPETAP